MGLCIYVQKDPVIFKVDNASGFFWYLEKISKTILQTVFSFILSGFFLVGVLCPM
jgi:hypothetical protein